MLIIFTFTLSTSVFADVDDNKIETNKVKVAKADTNKANKVKMAIDETLKIGQMVQALQGALLVRDDQSLDTIRLHGTDSRYYAMIRGWLFQELVGVESQLYATQNPKRSEELQTHSNFLKKAIRLIDLE